MLIDRPRYFDRIEPFIDKSLVKVLSGIRASGKSSILALIREHLKKNSIQDEQIIAINFESKEYAELRDFHRLYEYLQSLFDPLEGKAYLFLDEVQLVDQWERVVNSLLYEGKSDLSVAGSNSALTPMEISTYLTGRYIRLQIHRQAHTESDGYTRVNDIVDSILHLDVAEHFAIEDVDLLKRVLRMVAGSIGSPISAKQITRSIKRQGHSVDVSIIQSYLEAMGSAFLIYNERYDWQGRYLPGVVENIIYLELLRRGFEVCAGRVARTDIDFIATRRGEKRYIQAVHRLVEKEAVLRAAAPLLAIRNAWPKCVVTMESPFSAVV